MHHKTHYATVSEAINKLREQGFNVDFNLDENCIACESAKFDIEDLEIVDVYRYEGDSNPADEATVYAIESKSGLKGVLVSGYGMSTDIKTTQILEKLPIRK